MDLKGLVNHKHNFGIFLSSTFSRQPRSWKRLRQMSFSFSFSFVFFFNFPTSLFFSIVSNGPTAGK